jgi:hypothetical protein
MRRKASESHREEMRPNARFFVFVCTALQRAGKACLVLGKSDEAKQYYTHLVALDPHNAAAGTEVYMPVISSPPKLIQD